MTQLLKNKELKIHKYLIDLLDDYDNNIPRVIVGKIQALLQSNPMLVLRRFNFNNEDELSLILGFNTIEFYIEYNSSKTSINLVISDEDTLITEVKLNNSILIDKIIKKYLIQYLEIDSNSDTETYELDDSQLTNETYKFGLSDSELELKLPFNVEVIETDNRVNEQTTLKINIDFNGVIIDRFDIRFYTENDVLNFLKYLKQISSQISTSSEYLIAKYDEK